MPAFLAEDGMPFWNDLTTSDIRKSSHFYAEVLGWEFEDNGEYRLARAQGLPIAGIVEKQDDSQPDTWITYFLGTPARVEELGGRVLAESDIAQGRMAICVDPAGAVFGLIMPDGEESFVAAGEPGTPVWHELSCTAGYEEAVEFYRELFEWSTSAMDNENFRYTTAIAEGAAFAGIWDAKGNFPPQVPSFWQSYFGVKDIDAAVAKVPEVGGQVVREPWDTEFGRMAIISDSTGAVMTLTQVDEPVEEGREEDPLAGIDLSQFGIDLK